MGIFTVYPVIGCQLGIVHTHKSSWTSSLPRLVFLDRSEKQPVACDGPLAIPSIGIRKMHRQLSMGMGYPWAHWLSQSVEVVGMSPVLPVDSASSCLLLPLPFFLS